MRARYNSEAVRSGDPGGAERLKGAGEQRSWGAVEPRLDLVKTEDPAEAAGKAKRDGAEGMES